MFIITEPISCISSTQDNMCTLVSCTDSTLMLMDKQKGELLNEYVFYIYILQIFIFNKFTIRFLQQNFFFRYTGHTVDDYFIENCIFHNDSVIVSGSTCGNMLCWDFVNAQLIGKLKPNNNVSYTQPINSISTHPSKKLLIASCGPSISLWSE